MRRTYQLHTNDIFDHSFLLLFYCLRYFCYWQNITDLQFYSFAEFTPRMNRKISTKCGDNLQLKIDKILTLARVQIDFLADKLIFGSLALKANEPI